MRIECAVVQGSVPEAIEWVNRLGLANLVLNITANGSLTWVILKTEDYPSYVRLCEKRGIAPISTSEYFK